MSHVVTLISPGGLTPPHLVRGAAVLPAPGAPVWLAPGLAADIPFASPPGSDNAHWAEVVRDTLAGLQVDVVVQPLAHRRKRLLLADMDSTMIEQECIDELADALGLKVQVSAITRRSMQGEVPFEASLVERVALLRGLDLSVATGIVAERVTPMPGAATLVRTMRANGALTAIASGGFTIFTDAVARQIGFDRHYANTLNVEEGVLVGTLQAPIFGRESKREMLRMLRDELGLAAEDTMAVGDGANDLAMLEEAGLGVAFRAKPAVAAVARARIEHGDLTALLFVQGYTAAEFVE